jgi:hypothetical protein
VPAQQVVHEQHGREAVEEAAEGDGVDVLGSVAAEIDLAAQGALRAAHELARGEERNPGQPGPGGEDRPAVAGARRHLQVVAIDHLVMGVLVREVEVGIFHERAHVDVVAHAVAGNASAEGVELHHGQEEKRDQHDARPRDRARRGSGPRAQGERARRPRREQSGGERPLRPAGDDDQGQAGGHRAGDEGERARACHARASRHSSS